MNMKAKFADLVIEIEAKFPSMCKFCGKYLADSDADAVFSVSVSMEEIKAEDDMMSGVSYSENYLETLAILRKIAEQFPLYQRVLMHGATIEFGGKAYMFTALSGVGKSTHIRLWKKYLGEHVRIINGDKPFLWVKENEVSVYGSPWAGKENWHRNCQATLGGICFLKRGAENRIRRLHPDECLALVARQIYHPAGAQAAGLTLELLDKMLKTVPLYLLECDISESAVKTSFEAMTGMCLEDYRMKSVEVRDED